MTVFTTSIARPLNRPVEVVETLPLAGRRISHRALGVTRAWRYHDWRVALVDPCVNRHSFLQRREFIEVWTAVSQTRFMSASNCRSS